MGWMGKLIGGLLGYFFTRGPIGALVGAFLGHQFDKRTEELKERIDPASQHRIQAVFFNASFSIMGHIAKADGRVSEHEIAHAENVMTLEWVWMMLAVKWLLANSNLVKKIVLTLMEPCNSLNRWLVANVT